MVPLNLNLQRFKVLFWERCYKRRYISKEISVHELLENQDRKLSSKGEETQDDPLQTIL